MSNTVPRNELASIVLMADVALLVQKAHVSRVKEVNYFSDSAIAICWVLNSSRRLRMWVHNQATLVRTAMRWTTDQKELLPLFHIPGSSNIADLLTKPHNLTLPDLGEDSDWQSGMDWMCLPSDELPNVQFYVPLFPSEGEEFSKESYIEVGHTEVESSPLTAAPSNEVPPTVVGEAPRESPGPDDTECHGLLVDQLSSVWLSFVRLGWEKATQLLAKVHEATLRMRHGESHRKSPVASFPICQGTLEEACLLRAHHTIEFAASRELEKSVGKDRMISHFYLKDDVWYTSRRLEKEGQVDCQDLDFSPFFDS
jgi:hypothetical protein